MSENRKTLTQEEAEKLTSPNVVIPDGYANIGDSAFKKREDIVSVVIPDGVTSIDGGKYGGTQIYEKTLKSRNGRKRNKHTLP